MNHSRCCARDSGSSPVRGTGTSGGRAKPGAGCRAASTCRASAPSVGVAKNSRRESSAPRAERMRETTWVASSEWPPRSKKLSSAPTRGTPSNRAQMSASSVSVGVRGAAPLAPEDGAPGAGSALRSTLPFAVSGRAGSTTSAEGTMYSGRRCWR